MRTNFRDPSVVPERPPARPGVKRPDELLPLCREPLIERAAHASALLATAPGEPLRREDRLEDNRVEPSVFHEVLCHDGHDDAPACKQLSIAPQVIDVLLPYFRERRLDFSRALSLHRNRAEVEVPAAVVVEAHGQIRQPDVGHARPPHASPLELARRVLPFVEDEFPDAVSALILGPNEQQRHDRLHRGPRVVANALDCSPCRAKPANAGASRQVILDFLNAGKGA